MEARLCEGSYGRYNVRYKGRAASEDFWNVAAAVLSVNPSSHRCRYSRDGRWGPQVSGGPGWWRRSMKQGPFLQEQVVMESDECLRQLVGPRCEPQAQQAFQGKNLCWLPRLSGIASLYTRDLVGIGEGRVGSRRMRGVTMPRAASMATIRSVYRTYDKLNV